MIHYLLSLDSPSTHLFSVELRVAAEGAGHIDIEFPAWSPGRYFIYDFARNVQELHASAAGGENLPVQKIAKGTWRVACNGASEIRIGYRMFGNMLSGTFSQLDDRHASINGSSLFGYIVGRQQEQVELEIAAPEGWKIYTALPRRRRAGRTLFQAQNYDVLIDSPIEIGTPEARKFIHDGVTYNVIVDIAVAGKGRENRQVRERIDTYVADVEKVVKAYTAAFGRPEFDQYYFIANIDPYAPSGDGMEHLASTRLVLNGYITNDDDYSALIGVTSHEFFHIWNVKRLRPAELGPFDYVREQHTTLLWFAEGFTQYYGHLMLRRAGVWDEKQFYKELLREINTVDASPGRFHRNLRESSFDTWHAAGARNPMMAISNFRNTYVNYYHKGAVAALLLDLELRKRTDGRRSLDDLIRELYRTSYAEADMGEYFLRGNGYAEQDIYDAVETVGGADSRKFLERLVNGVDELDYAEYFAYVGLDLTRLPKKSSRKNQEPEPARPQLYTGLVVADARERAREEFVAVANVLPGSPAERSGFSAGDLIIAIDGDRTDGRRWDAVLAMKEPGDRMTITLFRGSRLMTLELRGEDRDIRPYRIEAIEGASPAQRRARSRWLGAAK